MPEPLRYILSDPDVPEKQRPRGLPLDGWNYPNRLVILPFSLPLKGKTSEGLIPKKTFLEIYQERFFCSPGDSGIQPPEIFDIQHLVAEVSLVDEYSIPLPALGFVAREGICEFHLQRIKMLTGFYLFRSFPAGRYISEVFKYRLEQTVVVGLRQCC